jgi:hypothetical protein
MRGIINYIRSFITEAYGFGLGGAWESQRWALWSGSGCVALRNEPARVAGGWR